MKKIYSKFTKERKKEYQIETAIYAESNIKYIDKIALNDESKAHVNKMMEVYKSEGLKEYLCPVRKIEDGHVRFIFLDGASISGELLEAFKKRDISEIEKCAEVYKNIFEKVQVDLVNLDLSFDNVIHSTSGYKVIDYEWTDEDMTKRDYSVYRAVNSFYIKNSELIKACYSYEEFCILFGLDVSKLSEYSEMEKQFNIDIFGEPGQSYNDTLIKYEKSINDVKEKYNHSNFIQFYFDYGNGFETDEAWNQRVYFDTEEYGCEVDNENVSVIRIDPLDVPFTCRNIQLFVQFEDETLAEVNDYDSNYIESDGLCIFCSDDPQIIFKNVWDKIIKKVIIDFSLDNIFNYNHYDDQYISMVDRCIDALQKSKNELEKRIIELEENQDKLAKDKYELEVLLDKKTEYAKKLVYMKNELNGRVNKLAAENLFLHTKIQ